jgi:hypothetical protein
MTRWRDRARQHTCLDSWQRFIDSSLYRFNVLTFSLPGHAIVPRLRDDGGVIFSKVWRPKNRKAAEVPRSRDAPAASRNISAFQLFLAFQLFNS